MGGIGNVRGAVLGGFIIGIIQQLSDARIGPEWTGGGRLRIPDPDHGPEPARAARRGDARGGMRDERAERAAPQERRDALGRERRRRSGWWQRGAAWSPCLDRDRDPAAVRVRRRPAGSSTPTITPLAFVVMALGPEHRRRLRRAARPRLRGLLRVRRLLRGLVRARRFFFKANVHVLVRGAADADRASTSTSC